MFRTLRTQLEQRALNCTDRRLGNIAVFERQFVRPLAAIDQHRLKVVEVD